MPAQSTNAVVMIRPHRFFPNPETALDNSFQGEMSGAPAEVAQRAAAEFDRAVAALLAAGVNVHAFEDTPNPPKPDAVFPNNWFSTHHDGRVVLYPMFTPSRRPERRADLIEALRATYKIGEVIDHSSYEQQGLFLEGTGSLVLDHHHRLAYVSLSRRADREPLERFCRDCAYEAVCFQSHGKDGRPIYHTNVMMSLGTEFALAGLETIADQDQREMVRARLVRTGKTVIELAPEQIENFAGNALELETGKGRILVLSARAARCLRSDQREAIERFAGLLPLELPTIELAGGSARCMLAEIFLPPR